MSYVKEYYDYTPNSRQRYGAPRDNGKRSHRGVDISHSTEPGTPVPSHIDGIVIGKRSPSSGHGFGYQVTVEAGNGETWSWAHGDSASPLKIGDTVGVGDIVITEGETGATSGPCSHVELYSGGRYIDPMPRINEIVGNLADETTSSEDDEMIVNLVGKKNVRSGGAYATKDGKSYFLGPAADNAPALSTDEAAGAFLAIYPRAN